MTVSKLWPLISGFKDAVMIGCYHSWEVSIFMIKTRNAYWEPED